MHPGNFHALSMAILDGVRCVAIDPVDNEWFITGSNDTTMKVWDLATGKLKTTLAGHVMTVRDVAVSDRHPYLFSVSEDKTVKCWDLRKTKLLEITMDIYRAFVR